MYWMVQEWSLRTGGLCVEVVFMDRWSLCRGGLYGQVKLQSNSGHLGQVVSIEVA